MLVRDNPALPPSGAREALLAEAVVEAMLWHCLDSYGGVALLARHCLDLASRTELLVKIQSAAADAETSLRIRGIQVAPVGSGRRFARDNGGRVARRVEQLARRWLSASCDFEAVRHEHRLWEIAWPETAKLICSLRHGDWDAVPHHLSGAATYEWDTSVASKAAAEEESAA